MTRRKGQESGRGLFAPCRMRADHPGGWNVDDDDRGCDVCRIGCSALEETARYLIGGIADTWSGISVTITARRHELDDVLNRLAQIGSAEREELRPTVAIRTLVVSPSEEARIELCRRMRADARFAVVGEAATPALAITSAAADIPDLVLIHLPKLDPQPLEQLAGLQNWAPRAVVVLVSGIDGSRVGDLLVTSSLAADWPWAESSPNRTLRGRGGSVSPRPAPAAPTTGPAVSPRASIVLEAMRQFGVPIRGPR